MKGDKAKVRITYYHYPNGKGSGGKSRELELTIDLDTAPRHSKDMDRIIPLIRTQVPFGDIDSAIMMNISRFNEVKEAGKASTKKRKKEKAAEEENEDYEINESPETLGGLLAENGKEMLRDITGGRLGKRAKEKEKWIHSDQTQEEINETIGSKGSIYGLMLLSGLWWCIKLPFKIIWYLIKYLIK